MIPPSWVAVLVLTASLAGGSLILKGQIQRNGELTASMAEQAASIKRLSDQAKEQEAEKERLSTILADREAAIRDNNQQAAADKEVVRVVIQQSPDIRRCSDVYWPADVMQRLREGSGNRVSDGQGKAPGAPADGLPSPPDT